MPRLVLHARSRLLRLLPLDLRLREVAVVRLPLVVVFQVSRAAQGEARARGAGGRVGLAHPLPGARVWRPHHDLLPDAAPRAPPRRPLRSSEPPASLGSGGGGRASEGCERVAGRAATFRDRSGCRVRALANAVSVNRKSPKYRYL